MSKNEKNIEELREKYSEDEITEYETDTDDENEPEVTKEFQDKVIEFIRLDDEIKDINKILKEKKARRKPLEKFILESLSQMGEKVVDITGGRLRRNKSETKKQLKQHQIKEALQEKIGDPTIVDQILKSMELKRETQIHVNIKRTSKRG
jgi:siroheme synthase